MALAAEIYSASAEENAIQFCFFINQYIRVSPNLNRLPVVDFLSCLLLAQSESANDVKRGSSFSLIMNFNFFVVFKYLITFFTALQHFSLSFSFL